MDTFIFLLNSFCLIIQSVMHLLFASGLTGKKTKLRDYASYIVLLCILDQIAARFSFIWVISIGTELLILYGMNRFALKNQPSVSWIASILAVYISQLSFGVVNSAESVLFPYIAGLPLLYVLIIFATIVSLSICAGCYALVLKSISLKEGCQLSAIGLLLFPALFCFAAELYIMQTSYTQTSFSNHLSLAFLLAETGKHTALLFLQILGLAGLFCTLHAYRKICRSFETQAALVSLTQAARAQKIYIEEAQMRCTQTKAFRHDIKNHLSVLDGLLSRGELEEGKAYLKKLEITSSALSFPYQTGNPVVDILLSEKLGLAKNNGITTDVALILPTPCKIDDFDLCVIFANALDNAIHACQTAMDAKNIRISGKQQGDFYMLMFENSCSDAPLPPVGTGLANIKSVAEKYHGAMEIEKIGQHFSLSVLLNISLHPENISRQKY